MFPFGSSAVEPMRGKEFNEIRCCRYVIRCILASDALYEYATHKRHG
jgi:hypothetical protein